MEHLFHNENGNRREGPQDPGSAAGTCRSCHQADREKDRIADHYRAQPDPETKEGKDNQEIYGRARLS